MNIVDHHIMEHGEKDQMLLNQQIHYLKTQYVVISLLKTTLFLWIFFNIKTLLDYDLDSDEEWEDEGEGESVDKSGDEEDMMDEDEEDDDGFFVPHGHLSDDEIDEENRIVNYY